MRRRSSSFTLSVNTDSIKSFFSKSENKSDSSIHSEEVINKRNGGIFNSPISQECFNLNKDSENCVYDKIDNNIVKIYHFYDPNIEHYVRWEATTYLKFIDFNIFPLVSIKGNRIVYHTKDLISLRQYFGVCDHSILKQFFNSLFTFIEYINSL